MPSEFEIEDLIEKLIFLQKVEIGQQESKEGKIVSLSEVKKKIRAKMGNFNVELKNIEC
jgi:hypothetical protein